MNGANIILSLRDVQARVSLSRSSLYRLEMAGKFPRRVKLGEHRVGWRASEIDEWIAARPAAALCG